MIAIFAGGVRPLPPDNQPSGIFKAPVVMPMWLGCEGLSGDAQADRRVHGGAEKALHQYPVAHYAALAAAFPDAAELLRPGSIGENLSLAGWDEANVCIGDSFQFGDSVIQVSQPRTPCWKIDYRFEAEGMAQFIDANLLTGWYFRVLEEGAVEPGCDFRLLERPSPEVTLKHLLSLWQDHRPAPEALEAVADTPTLAVQWVKKLRDRALRLRQLP
jgi:MOSC domain-containing protein YiiM